MITTALINFFVQPLQAALSVLPTGALFSTSSIQDGAVAFGQWLGWINQVFPVTDILEMLVITYVAILPFIVVYKIAEWVYCHIPEILGFGPGPG